MRQNWFVELTKKEIFPIVTHLNTNRKIAILISFISSVPQPKHMSMLVCGTLFSKREKKMRCNVTKGVINWLLSLLIAGYFNSEQ